MPQSKDSNESNSLLELVDLLQPLIASDGPTLSRDALQKTRAKMVHALAQLCRCINTNARINKLPTEMLAKIFDHGARPFGHRLATGLNTKEIRYGTSGGVTIRPLLTITHVCSLWRKVALRQRTLWTVIGGHRWKQIKAFVRRSQGAPLFMHLHLLPVGHLTKILQKYGKRAARLDISLGRDSQSAIPHLRAAMSNLESLTLNIRDMATVRVQHGPEIFGTGTFPTLRALAMSPTLTMLTTEASRFPRLTHLHLSGFYYWTTFAGIVEDLRRMLCGTPLLEDLHLTGLKGLGERVPSTFEEPVTLGLLRSLTCIRSELECALFLLAFIKFPATAMVRLNGLSCDTPDQVEFPRLSLAPGFLESPTSMEFSVVISAGHSVFHFAVRSASSALWIHAYSPICRGCVWTPLGRWFLGTLPLSSIEKLRVSLLDGHIVQNLLSRMSRLTDIRYLVSTIQGRSNPRAEGVVDTFFGAFLDALARGPPLCCPELASFSIEAEGPDPENFRVSELVSMTAMRSSQGHPIRHLTVHPRHYRGCYDGKRWDNVYKSFLAAFSPAEKHVQDVHISRVSGCTMDSPYEWRGLEGEASQYWELPTDDKPSYYGPHTRR